MGTESWADDVREAQTNVPTLAPHLLFIHTGLLNNFAIDIKSIQSYKKIKVIAWLEILIEQHWQICTMPLVFYD